MTIALVSTLPGEIQISFSVSEAYLSRIRSFASPDGIDRFALGSPIPYLRSVSLNQTSQEMQMRPIFSQIPHHNTRRSTGWYLYLELNIEVQILYCRNNNRWDLNLKMRLIGESNRNCERWLRCV